MAGAPSSRRRWWFALFLALPLVVAATLSASSTDGSSSWAEFFGRVPRAEGDVDIAAVDVAAAVKRLSIDPAAVDPKRVAELADLGVWLKGLEIRWP